MDFKKSKNKPKKILETFTKKFIHKKKKSDSTYLTEVDTYN